MEEKIVIKLFKSYSKDKLIDVVAMPLSGSSRRYFRLITNNSSVIGVYNTDVQENDLFIRMSFHFRDKGLPVPEIIAVSSDHKVYLQTDLGDTMLLDVVENSRSGTTLPTKVITLYKQALSTLLCLQKEGGIGFNFSQCVPRPEFDKIAMRWDLDYFKYCFLRLAGINVSEQLLEDDFINLLRELDSVERTGFMFRDFQSRNIMVKEEKVYFIDYQGGRLGALHYDVASLLYDPIVNMPAEQRESLLDYYILCLSGTGDGSSANFKEKYYHFALLRMLQALGAFGLRGLHEKKQHFIDSIVPGLQTVTNLFDLHRNSLQYPEIEKAIATSLSRFS